MNTDENVVIWIFVFIALLVLCYETSIIYSNYIKDVNCQKNGFDGFKYSDKIINGNLLIGTCYRLQVVCTPYELQTHTECTQKIQVEG